MCDADFDTEGTHSMSFDEIMTDPETALCAIKGVAGNMYTRMLAAGVEEVGDGRQTEAINNDLNILDAAIETLQKLVKPSAAAR